ncbi:glycosyltransferase family 2 protein [Fulvivirgaceae bacterium BMA12]|uniref:Glycosyltransferase family 2 protein n=1 Tax=Agaribacillus aureus TaxID=3051825 RepID=A0ABT8L262_9BACT|nr:glycosyltransferase family 2 protein [Fulvivirgaceae bacterium BMA12]
MELSIVITVFNEEQNIRPLLYSLYDALTQYQYEIIMVDDGSTDKTIEEIKKYANDSVKLLIFNKNYGQTPALSAGIEEAQGAYIVTMDGDLQNDPMDIPNMLKKLKQENCDVVAGVRAKRQDSLLIRKVPSKVANYIIRTLTGVKVNDYGCSIRVFRADIAKNLGLYGELHRFIPVLAKLQGAKIEEMPVNHKPRIFGKSKYGLGRTFKVLCDLLLMIFFQKFFQKPIHLFGSIGLLTFMFGMGINIYFLIEKLLGQNIWGRPLLLVGVILTLGGIQLITAGFMAEMLTRTYFESQNKTTYRIKEKFFGKPEVTSYPEMAI